MENLIEIQDVVKRFGEQTVLDHVSLSVTPGKYMESSEGTEAARQFFLKASVVLSCRMRGNPGSWQTGGEGCGYPTGNWNYY